MLRLTTILHPFNGLFFRTTWASQYDKDKTSLNLSEAIDDGVLESSGISWTICKQSAPCSRPVLLKNIFRYRHLEAINVKTGMPPFGILANHKIKMCYNSMKKIMIQKITQNNWNFWTVNLIMWAKKLLTSRQIFWYAVPARNVTKKHCT